MAKFQLTASKGMNTVAQETNLPEGFLTLSTGVYYFPDQKPPHKIPGKTEAGDLPSGATQANTKGIDFIKFKNTGEFILAATNSKLSSSAISGDSLGSWTDAQDLQGTPANFPFTGSILKSIPDGRNRYFVFSGTKTERPLLMDEDRNVRYAGLNPSSPFTYPTSGLESSAVLATQATVTRPNANSNPGGTLYGRPVVAFTNPELAYDIYDTTYAEGVDTVTTSTYVADYTFPGGATAFTGQMLIIHLRGVSVTGIRQSGLGTPLGFQIRPDTTITAEGTIRVLVSQDSGSNFTEVYTSSSLEAEDITLQYNFADDNWNELVVRVTFEYQSGQPYEAGVQVLDIYSQDDDAGSQTLIDQGTYYYAYTEVFTQSLDTGVLQTVESAPSLPIPVTVSTDAYGVRLVLPTASKNNDTEGVEHDPVNGRYHYRKVYRTTKTGSWPDLGYLQDVAIGATEFLDMFTVTGETLGSPVINTVSVGINTHHANTPPPNFRDATLHKGAIVAIPATSPYELAWSLPGYPEYWAEYAQRLSLLPSRSNDELKGVVSLGEALIIFTTTRTERLRDLQFADRPNYDLTRIEREAISQSQGLAGGPKSYCLFEMETGRKLLAWVSHSGIWMTDGSTVTERGMGAVKLSRYMDWANTVGKDALSNSRLTYDSDFQVIHFDYDDSDGNRKTISFHVAPLHWVTTGKDQLVPKWLGPHPSDYNAIDRASGEVDGTIKSWSVNTLKVYNERTGTDAAGSSILSVVEGGWEYPAGDQGEFHLYLGSMFHSDWGKRESCDIEVVTRRDESGEISTLTHNGLPLVGKSKSGFYINRAGQSMKIRWRHRGDTTSSGTPKRTFGPFTFEASAMGDTEED